jgi:hypothetical protein
MIDDGILVSQGTDPVVVENAARVAMTRPFLLPLLNGMDRPQSTDAMVKEYKDLVPSPAVLQATTLAALLASSPFAVNLPFALPAPGSPAPPPAPVSTPPPPYKPPPPQTYAPVATSVRGTPSGAHGPLVDDPSRAGFRRDSAGLSYHMGWYNGEYSTPPGWAPPAGCAWTWPGQPLNSFTTPQQRSTPPRNLTTLSIPCAKSVAGSASPFSSSTTQPCDVCGRAGHAQYECPRRFLDTYSTPLPGFLPSGDQDPSAWRDGVLTEAARTAMAEYLHQRNVPAHRKYQVTLAHIAAGTPPPLRA